MFSIACNPPVSDVYLVFSPLANATDIGLLINNTLNNASITFK